MRAGRTTVSLTTADVSHGRALKDVSIGGMKMNSDTSDKSRQGFSFSCSYWLLCTS